MAITIPDPVITVTSWTSYANRDVTKFTVDIQVGNVVVMTRAYNDDDEHYDSPTFAYAEDEARERALTEFGEKIRNLIGEQ